MTTQSYRADQVRPDDVVIIPDPATEIIHTGTVVYTLTINHLQETRLTINCAACGTPEIHHRRTGALVTAERPR